MHVTVWLVAQEFSIYLGYGQAYEQNRGGKLPKDFARILVCGEKHSVFDTNIKSPSKLNVRRENTIILSFFNRK